MRKKQIRLVRIGVKSLLLMGLMLNPGEVMANTGNNYKSMTKKFEGFRSRPYKDADTTSVGYGFNIASGGIPEDVASGRREMTMPEADNLFERKYSEAEIRARQFAGPSYDKLNDNQKAVLNDMSYNLGNRLFKFKKMKSDIDAGAYKDVPAEMKNSLWAKQVGSRSDELQNLWNRG